MTDKHPIECDRYGTHPTNPTQTQASERIDLQGGWYLEAQWCEADFKGDVVSNHIAGYSITSPCGTLSTGHMSVKTACEFAAAMQPAPSESDGLTIADYEECLADHRRLVRELDVGLNGEEGAAEQASLCDIVGQVKDRRWRLVRAIDSHQTQVKAHAAAVAEAKGLREALVKVSNWRKLCHDYDEDMGYIPRTFSDEDWEQLEFFVDHVLTATQEGA